MVYIWTFYAQRDNTKSNKKMGWIIYIFSVVYALLLCLYQRHQFNDLKTIRDIRWKTYRVITSAFIYSSIYIATYIDITLKDLLLGGSIFWVVFELGTNVISLNSPLLYVGKSSILDNKLDKYKWIFIFGFFVLSLIIKII